MVKAIARQLDRCDVCGKKIHKRDLVLTNVDFLAVGGSNYFTYSSYNSSLWTIDTSSDGGVISIGPYADRARISVSDGNTLTEVQGSKTLTGSGTVRTSSLVDVSSWDSMVFALDVGAYQQNTDVEVAVAIGTCDSDGSNKVQAATFTANPSARAWAYILPTSITDSSAAYFYVTGTVSTGDSWWIDRMQLIKNATGLTGNAFIPTAGSTVDRVDTPSMTVRKVCPLHRERLLSRTERYGKNAEQRTDEPVAVDIQEV